MQITPLYTPKTLNFCRIVTVNSVTGILAKISLGAGIWAKFRLGTGIWYLPSRPSHCGFIKAIEKNIGKFIEMKEPFSIAKQGMRFFRIFLSLRQKCRQL